MILLNGLYNIINIPILLIIDYKLIYIYTHIYIYIYIYIYTEKVNTTNRIIMLENKSTFSLYCWQYSYSVDDKIFKFKNQDFYYKFLDTFSNLTLMDNCTRYRGFF